MTQDRYDAIVVGARCAGSPAAMLLARTGHRVLLVDRSTFPSDTLSTHILHPPGVAALQRWGLLDGLTATNCPPIGTYRFDFGPITISGAPGTPDSPVAYCPRRTVLDKLLVDAAADAGAEVREGFTVEEVVVEDGRVCGIRGHDRGGATVTERAAWSSARTVATRSSPGPSDPSSITSSRLCCVVTTRTGATCRRRRGFAFYARQGRGWAVAPTHDDLTLVVVRLAVRGARRQQGRRRGQLPHDVRLRARVRRADPPRHAPGPLRRHRGTQLLPEAVRSRLGAGR